MFTVSPHNKYLCESGSLNKISTCYVCALEAQKITDKICFRVFQNSFLTGFRTVNGGIG